MTSIVHKNEDEYFARQDADWISQRRAHLDAQRRRAERASHHMKCPNCGADLAERSYHHVTVDVCSECHGTWLGPGELEVIGRVKRNEFSRFIGSLFGLR
jgi:ribosomal protein L31